MPELYTRHSSDAKTDAQRNLCGRTHYVDDGTLRWHKSRVMSTRATDEGLLFAIVTSDALDMNNTKRGFRYVIFDLFGTVLSRVDLEQAFRTSAAAEKTMWAELERLDAAKLTLDAIEAAERDHDAEMQRLRAKVAELATKAA